MSETKRIKIIYKDGPAQSAKIVDAETGEIIDHIHRVELTLDVNEVPSARIYVYAPITDVTITAEVHTVCPYCGNPISNEEPGED